MSYSISTLLTRNLHDVFDENDPERLRTAIGGIFTDGRDEIHSIAGKAFRAICSIHS